MKTPEKRLPMDPDGRKINEIIAPQIEFPVYMVPPDKRDTSGQPIKL